MNKIIIYHEGGVIHDVKGVPAGVELEFRDTEVEDVIAEDCPNHLEQIEGVTYYVIRFNAEEKP